MNQQQLLDDLLQKTSGGDYAFAYAMLAPAAQDDARHTIPPDWQSFIDDGKYFFQQQLDRIQRVFCGNAQVRKLLENKDFERAIQILVPLMTGYTDKQIIALAVLLFHIGATQVCADAKK